jgi:dCMP deaminase
MVTISSTHDLPRDYLKAKTCLEIAHALGTLSTCDRKAVGAVIVRDGRCISWGYNGAPPGLPHCDEVNHGYPRPPGTVITSPGIVEEYSKGCLNVTHAEANAIAFAARQGISTEGSTLYVTVSPCEVCARLLIAAGIERVVYEEEHREDAGIRLLRKAGVIVIP